MKDFITLSEEDKLKVYGHRLKNNVEIRPVELQDGTHLLGVEYSVYLAEQFGIDISKAKGNIKKIDENNIPYKALELPIEEPAKVSVWDKIKDFFTVD